MCRNKLIGTLAEHEVAYLGTSIYRVYLLANLHVVELDASISGTASTGEQTALMWTPSYGLNSGFVT